MIKIFVLHYKKLTTRKDFILKQFKDHGIVDFEFIEIYDVDESDITEKEKILFNLNDPDFINNPGRLSIILKHIHAYKLIEEKYDAALIFEDDVILSPGFVNTLESYVQQLPSDYDMLFIGNGCNFHIPKDRQVSGCNIYERGTQPTAWGGDGITRCTDSYIVSKKCAQKMMEHINNISSGSSFKIFKAIDWWLNETARANNFTVYWAEPTIVCQGTQTGLYSSSNW